MARDSHCVKPETPLEAWQGRQLDLGHPLGKWILDPIVVKVRQTDSSVTRTLSDPWFPLQMSALLSRSHCKACLPSAQQGSPWH